jgi:hypothetical protein
MRDPQSPLEYLVTSSQTSLEAFELARLNRAANLRKELRDVLDEWMQTEIDVRMARWILECRRAQNTDSDSLAASPREPARIGQLAMSFLPESSGTQSESVAPRIPHALGEVSEERALACRSRNPRSAQVDAQPHFRSGHRPMTSRDADASLRLLEQFLARPAASIVSPAENHTFGSRIPAAATGLPAAIANVSSRSSPAPHRNRPSGNRSASERTAAARRGKLHAAPTRRFLQRARHNQ